jgi:hypothetical protein
MRPPPRRLCADHGVLIVMIGAKTMIRSLCRRLLTICAVIISIAVVTISPSLSAPDFDTADALMLRLLSTYNDF